MTELYSREFKKTYVVDKELYNNFSFDKSYNVYVLKAKKINIYKIGVTTNLDKRIFTIGVKFPYELELYMNFEGACYDFEKYLHNIFSNYQLRGEWFNREILRKLWDISNDITYLDKFGVTHGKYDKIISKWTDLEGAKYSRLQKEYCEKEKAVL